MQNITVTHKPLTFDYLNSLGELKYLIMHNTGIYDSESETDEDLFDLDFQEWTITIGNNEYKCIFGWPGDNPVGVVFRNGEILVDIDEGEFVLDETLTETEKNDIDQFEKWFKEKQKEGFECN